MPRARIGGDDDDNDDARARLTLSLYTAHQCEITQPTIALSSASSPSASRSHHFKESQLSAKHLLGIISWIWERLGIARKSLSFVSAAPHPLCRDSQLLLSHEKAVQSLMFVIIMEMWYWDWQREVVLTDHRVRPVCVCGSEAAEVPVHMESRCIWSRGGLDSRAANQR